MSENPAYIREQLITYIGNKRKLLPYIGQAVEQVAARLGKPQLDIIDLFSGTGVVARYLKRYARQLTVNDLELYSEITNQCYLTNHDDARLAGLADTVQQLHEQALQSLAAGFITQHYAPQDDNDIQHGERVFYTRRNAMYLDTARALIAQQPKEIQVFLLAPLLALASVHANTSGVFKGFYKSEQGVGQFGGRGRNALSRIVADITLQAPIFSHYSCDVQVFREDANVWVKDAAHRGDVAYLDPPYNQHPYGSNYFMLNMLAEYEPPQQVSRISGIPTTWNRSRYNQKGQAEEALFEVIEQLNASHIILSYNAEGFISQERFVERLSRIGTVQTVDIPYPTFRGSRNLRARSKQVVESLYVVEKK